MGVIEEWKARNMAEPYPKNVPGPFYVENACCITCGIPTEEAPEVFAWDHNGEFDSHCFVHCQPQTPEAISKGLKAIKHAEIDCIRYRGSDPAIKQRLVEQGSEDNIDPPPTQ